MHNAMLERDLESPYTEWLERWEKMGIKAREITTYIPCGDFFEIRDKALIAHATQIDPDGGWFRVPRTSSGRSGRPRSTSWRSRSWNLPPRARPLRGHPRELTI